MAGWVPGDLVDGPLGRTAGRAARVGRVLGEDVLRDGRHLVFPVRMHRAA